MKPMTGSIFKQTEKKDPNHSDWNGALKMDDNTEYWASGYDRKDSNGNAVINILLRNKKEPYQKRAADDKNNFGTLERNSKKTEDRHPDRRGKINVMGKDYWISAWDNKTRNGDKEYIKLVLSPMGIDNNPSQNEESWVQPKTDKDSNLTESDIDIGVPPDFDD